MANQILIKRSLNTASPGTLANGEMAYTANGDVLFIGSNSTLVAVGGKRVPGTLTANQAIVPNSVSLVDQLKLGNTIANVVITATGIALSNTDGEGNTITITTPNTTEKGGNYYLKADGSWSTVTGATADPGGSNTTVQYNDSGVMNGVAGFTYDESTNTVFSGNTIIAGGGTTNAIVNTSTIQLQSNSTHFARLTESTLRLSNTVSNTQITIPNTTERAGSYFLKADGTWSLVSAAPGGADTQVLFNDGGSVSNGTAGFTFTKGTNNVVIANTLTVGSTTVVNTTHIQMATGFQANTTALNPTSNTVALGNTIGRWVITANSVATQGVEANATALNPTSNTILLGNTIGRWVITANSITTTGLTGNATMGTATAFNVTNQTNTATLFVTTSANIASSNVIANTQGLFIANTTGVVNAFSLKTAGILANTTALVPTSNTILLGNTIGRWVISANSIDTTGNITSAGQVNAATIYAATSVNVGSNRINSTALLVGSASINTAGVGTFVDLNVSGNLTVSGTVTTVDTTNLIVQDPLIRLADDQANTASYTDNLDIGFYGTYGNTTQTEYTGLFRDSSNTGVWTLFSGEIPSPTSTIDTANVNYATDTLVAWLRAGTGSGIFSVNSTGTTITANSTWAVALTANSLSLTTQLTEGSGGTGETTYAAGDLLVGDAGTGLSKLARGTDGYVLQANSTTITWGVLDGGTF